MIPTTPHYLLLFPASLLSIHIIIYYLSPVWITTATANSYLFSSEVESRRWSEVWTPDPAHSWALPPYPVLSSALQPALLHSRAKPGITCSFILIEKQISS